jgi:hypothetical protein
MLAGSPALVTLHLWRVDALGALPWRLSVDRRAIRRTPGLRFARLLGTAPARTFAPRDADPRRWALLCSWATETAAREFEIGAVVTGWRRIAGECWRAELIPIASRGAWAGQQPFGDGGAARPAPARPVAALTHARLNPCLSRRFRRAVPAVAAELATQDGLRLALGIGERPWGRQGTFSVWESAERLLAFAHAPRHAAVVSRTNAEGWYAEELFARFAVLRAVGTVDGRDPLA